MKFSSNLYDAGGFTAHWEDLADERKELQASGETVRGIGKCYATHSIKLFPCDAEFFGARATTEAQSKS